MGREDDDDLGARVRAARSYADKSQQQLADEIGVERRIVTYIEANDPRHPLSIKEAQRIAQVTNVPISFLLNGWTSAPELIERVDALTQAIGTANADRDRMAAEIEALHETLEKRFAELSSRALPQDGQQRRAADRREA